jgi:hypothetical protein
MIVFTKLYSKLQGYSFKDSLYTAIAGVSGLSAFISLVVAVSLMVSVSTDRVLKEKIAFYENELQSKEQTSVTATTLHQQIQNLKIQRIELSDEKWWLYFGE